MLSGAECVVNAVQCSHPAVHENSEQVCKYSTHLAIRILFHILIDTIQLCGNYKYKPSYNLMIKSCSFSLEVFFWQHISHKDSLKHHFSVMVIPFCNAITSDQLYENIAIKISRQRATLTTSSTLDMSIVLI